MFLSDRETHRGVERAGAGRRHGGVQGAPDGHWGHLIHTTLYSRQLDKTSQAMVSLQSLHFSIFLD